MPSRPLPLTRLALASSCILLALTGCGGLQEEEEPALPAAGDASLYQPLLDYCAIRTPDAGSDWSLSMSNPATGHNMAFTSSTLVSVNGNTNLTAIDKIDLKVALTDYRGVRGEYMMSGSADAAVTMGVRLQPLLGPRSVACVSPVSRFVASPPLGGQPRPPLLVWSSYWNPNSLPVTQAGGNAVDAFELTSNFTPQLGSVFFNLPKSRFASTQGLSLCVLTPRASQWNCSQPTTTDAGAYWTVSQPGAQAGVYLLKHF